MDYRYVLTLGARRLSEQKTNIFPQFPRFVMKSSNLTSVKVVQLVSMRHQGCGFDSRAKTLKTVLAACVSFGIDGCMRTVHIDTTSNKIAAWRGPSHQQDANLADLSCLAPK